MLDDRSYMQQPTYRQGLSGTVKLMIVIGVAFALQMIDQAYNSSGISRHLSLNPEDIKRGYLWQFLTFQFLHGGPWHLLCNMLAVFCFGRALEGALGTGRMISLFLLSGLAGGVLQFVMSVVMPGSWSVPALGASAGTAGFLAAFARLDPHGTVILYFVPVRAQILLYVSLALSFFLTVVPAESGVAHPAHLGGLLAGLAMMRYGIPELNLNFLSSIRERFQTRHIRVLPKPSGSSSSWQAESVPQRRSRAEDDDEEYMKRVVNPILDKISAHGNTSCLTEEEKKILHAASSRMKKN